MSLDEPEPVDSVLMFLSGYDTPKYSRVKATAVSVCLRILFVMLQNTNTRLRSGAVRGNGKKKVTVYFAPSAIRFPARSDPAIDYGSVHCIAFDI